MYSVALCWFQKLLISKYYLLLLNTQIQELPQFFSKIKSIVMNIKQNEFQF